jgi:hypothetical protein
LLAFSRPQAFSNGQFPTTTVPYLLVPVPISETYMVLSNANLLEQCWLVDTGVSYQRELPMVLHLSKTYMLHPPRSNTSILFADPRLTEHVCGEWFCLLIPVAKNRLRRMQSETHRVSEYLNRFFSKLHKRFFS